MSGFFAIKQGLDLSLEGKPSGEIVDVSKTDRIILHPSEFTRAKPRLEVAPGDKVKKGTVLYYDKRNPAFKYRSPVAGTIKDIVLGARRSLQEIHIDVSGRAVEKLPSFSADALLSADRTELLNLLSGTGLLSLLTERPFSRPATVNTTPKSIFVNGMANAPFRPDPNIVLQGREVEFAAGLAALKRLTLGPVHLCLDADETATNSALTAAKGVEISYFSGPHPSGNTSTHIHHLDPIFPGDVVWAINACDLVQIGELLTTGQVPSTKVIMAAGPGLSPEARRYYKVAIGQPISSFLGEAFVPDTEARIVDGDVFCGTPVTVDSGVRTHTRGLTVLSEDRERHLLGWMMPGYDKFSTFRTYMSSWFGAGRDWNMGTSRNGSHRSMVLTGIYDKYVPLDIMVDSLSRACIGHDTDDAIRHGILGTDPEDFALCSVVCPSKTDFCEIIRKGLAEIEAEGL